MDHRPFLSDDSEHDSSHHEVHVLDAESHEDDHTEPHHHSSTSSLAPSSHSAHLHDEHGDPVVSHAHVQTSSASSSSSSTHPTSLADLFPNYKKAKNTDAHQHSFTVPTIGKVCQFALFSPLFLSSLIFCFFPSPFPFLPFRLLSG
jgi:hypothetical protein